MGLVRAISLMQHVARCFRKLNDCKGWHYCSVLKNAEAYKTAEIFIIKTIYREFFLEEIECLMEGRALSRGSSFLPSSPFIDADGLLRVGGRLRHETLTLNQIDSCPILIPKSSHLEKLLLLQCQERVIRHGLRITKGKLYNMDFWVIRAKKFICSFLRKCVTCKRLRGRFCSPKMADLPQERLDPGISFTYVGVDSFGPWKIFLVRPEGANLRRRDGLLSSPA